LIVQHSETRHMLIAQTVWQQVDKHPSIKLKHIIVYKYGNILYICKKMINEQTDRDNFAS
jgi:hypothetical protein